MTNNPHDQLAKQYLEIVLKLLGTVKPGHTLYSEIRQIDVWFIPNNTPASNPQLLGLLGRIAATACVLEPFRNPPSAIAIRNCQSKLNAIQNALLRQARRDNIPAPADAALPPLWILSPSCSPALRDGFCAKLDPSGQWENGIYFLPKYQQTRLVAINQLPVNTNTLWVRILGRGKTQENAINELIALPPEHPLRQDCLEILANWRMTLQIRENLEKDDRELMMNLSPAYLQWKEETFQEGRQEGRQEEIKSLLAEWFGELDQELSRIVQPLVELPVKARTRLLLNLSHLSREDLLSRFPVD